MNRRTVGETMKGPRPHMRVRVLVTALIAFLFFASSSGTAWAAWVSWLNLSNAYKYSWFSSGSGSYTGVSATSGLTIASVARVRVSGTVHEAVYAISVTHSRRTVSYGCSWKPMPGWEQLTTLNLNCERQT